MATPTAIDKELIQAEKTYWDAMQKKDRATIRSLTGDHFMMTMEEGVTSMPSDQFIDMMLGEDMKVRSYKLDESTATVGHPRDDIAILAYKAHMEYEQAGKPGTIDAYYTTTWVRDGQKWRAVAGSESRAKK
jgi:hypothetical protein